MAREAFAERVTRELLAQLERGTSPFQKRWEPTTELPHNPTTGRRYRGANALFLFSQGYGDPRWLTYQQALAAGAQVRRGERGTPIEYWKFAEAHAVRDAKGEVVRDQGGQVVKAEKRLARPAVFHATVFNAEQIDGLPERASRKLPWDPCERADALLRDSGARIDHAARDKAYYMPARDMIFMPQREQFATRENYYAVALHELGHWTGHASRLARDILHPFGSAAYAREELRAEIASLILGYEIGVGHDSQNHASYIAAWISVLKRDPLELMRAAADAEKISTYVLGLSQDRVDERSPEAQPQRMDAAKLPMSTQSAQQERFLHFWAPEPSGPELGAECLSLSYVAPFELGGQRFMSIEHRLMLEKAQLAGERELAAGILRARDAAELQELGPGVRRLDEGPHEARLIDAVLGATAAKFRQHPPLARYLLTTGDRVLAASGEDRRWGIGMAHGDPQASDRNQWQGENLLGFVLMAVRSQLRREHGIERLPQEERFEHAGLQCSLEAHRSAVSGDTWLTGYVELPPGHPLHGYDFESRRNGNGVVVTKEVSICERTAGGAWRVGFDSAGEPEVVRAEFLGHVRELAEELADRARQEETMMMHSLPAERAQQQDEVMMPALPPRLARTERTERAARHWLAVPYEERVEANACGARWDRDAKCWYAPTGANLDRLGRWEPGPTTDYAPALGARDEFAQVLRDLGCQLSGDHPIIDGRPHRIRTHGDRGSEKAGFYVASLSPGAPSGYAIDNRTGEVITWRAKGFHLTSEEKAQARAEALRKQEERERDRQRMYASSAEFLVLRLRRFVKMETITPYLAAKGVQLMAGLFTDRESRLTVVPGYDVAGRMWTLQYIQPDGSKRFSRNARQAGCCHPVGGWGAVAQAPLLILAEGYATAATVAQVIGRPTVACFNASNLVNVARGLRERFPGKPILIAADDDRKLERERGKNPGIEFARKAADEVGGSVVRPVFSPSEDALTDFNDLAQTALGKTAVQQQLEAAISTLKAETLRAQQHANTARTALRKARHL